MITQGGRRSSGIAELLADQRQSRQGLWLGPFALRRPRSVAKSQRDRECRFWVCRFVQGNQRRSCIRGGYDADSTPQQASMMATSSVAVSHPVHLWRGEHLPVLRWKRARSLRTLHQPTPAPGAVVQEHLTQQDAPAMPQKEPHHRVPVADVSCWWTPVDDLKTAWDLRCEVGRCGSFHQC